MNDKLTIKCIGIYKVSPKEIELMKEELKQPSEIQKLSEEMYKLEEENGELEAKFELLKDDRDRLKKVVEASIAIIIGTTYENVDTQVRLKLDDFRKKAAKVLGASDLLEASIGE